MAEKTKKTLKEVLDEKSDKLLKEWAERNKKVVWLGNDSRSKVKQEVSDALRWAYDLAKNRYSK